VEGESFTAEVIARVRAVDERGLVRRLSNELDRQHHLVESQGIRRLGTQPLSSYHFRHNLFQRYLYHSLDAAQKAYLHQDVGSVLEALYGDQAAEIAVQLGRHFDEAGLAEKAIHYLRLAAERAMQVSANVEAIGHLTRALALLQTLPPTRKRDRLELPLQMELITATMVAEGWASPSLKAALDRARQLCCVADDPPRLVPVLRGLFEHYYTRAEHSVAYELARHLLALAQEILDPPLLVMAHQGLGQVQDALGDFVAARKTLERGLTYHDPERYRDLAYLYGEEHGVSAHLHLTLVLLVLGYPDQALAHGRKGLAIAEDLAHPHVLAYTY
jgi:predicted ATPase